MRGFGTNSFGVRSSGSKPFGVLPFGGSADTWAADMLASYISLHTTLPAGVEAELLARLQPGGYLYTTFGPTGQDKSVCDFVLGFKFTGTILSRNWIKSAGGNLRWDFDGHIESVADPNDLPGHTFVGGDAGILTVSTTDTWSGLTVLDMNINPFVGEFPNVVNAGMTNLIYLRFNNTQFTRDIADFIGQSSLSTLRLESSLVSGDVADISSLTALIDLRLNSSSVDDVSGAFVNAGLKRLDLQDNSLSQAEVDTVLANYVNVHNAVGLTLTSNYIINLGGTNAAPSAAGLEHISTLKALDWATGGGSVTITVSGVSMFYTMTTTAQSSANLRLDKVGTNAIVNWGDGTIEAVSKTAYTSHAYASPYTGGVVYYADDGNAITYFDSSDNKYKFAIASLPAGLTYFICYGSNIVSGNIANLPIGLTYFICYGLNTVSGDIANLPVLLTFFRCYGSNTVSGNIANLPIGLTTFNCAGSNTVSGNIASLPVGLTNFICYGSNIVSGDIASLPVLLTYFYCTGLNIVSGDIASLPVGLTYFYCTGSNTVSIYTSGKVWANNMSYVLCLPVASSGLDATEVDNLLIDLALVGTWAGSKAINIAGNNATRTSASDAAINTLRVTKGVTVTVNE